jgi:sugar/nucleoside kinase (ribokinase family)
MRNGILAGGNFIIDYVKLINGYPEQDMLADIRSETSSNGGGPYNVLKDLAAMRVGYPLSAAGLVGKDANGDWILRDCQRVGIDTTQIRQTDHAPTSYTDAMTVISTGRRTFFHQRGANALLGEGDFDFSQTQARLFHLGYLMLLDEMDRLLPDGSTPAAQVLAKAQAAGLITTVDIVSTENPNFRSIAEAALPHTDYLIINEVEAGKILGLNLKTVPVDFSAVSDAARALLAKGVQKQVVIHFESGAVVADSGGGISMQASLKLPPGFIVGATGAGDAFAAGYLHGIHEGWSIADSLTLAVCTAAACLTHPTPSEGLRPVKDCLHLADEHGFRLT